MNPAVTDHHLLGLFHYFSSELHLRSRTQLRSTSMFVFVATLIGATFSVGVSSSDEPEAKAGELKRPPNIVFILADDLGYGDLGCFGQEKIKTPRIDELARQGLRMTQHYSGNAVCAPSRCVLLTGRDPGHAFVRNNRSTPPIGQFPIPDSEVTLGERLKSAGYATGAFGKWGLGGPDSSGRPLNQGFDRFVGYLCQRVAHSYYPAAIWDDEKPFPLANDPPVPGHARLPSGSDPNRPESYASFQGDDYASDHINAAAVEFIREHAGEPFFLYYPTIIPHVALHVPDEYVKPYRDLGWNDPPYTNQGKGASYTPHFTPRAAYAGMISYMDSAVGRVLDELERQGVAENTLVVFTSDNGPTHLRQVDVDFFNSAGGLRGLKGSLDEGGVRVPTIVRWPGYVEPGTTTDFVSGFEDWLPTIASIVGDQGKAWPATTGVNLSAVLSGRDAPARDYLYREFSAYGGQQMIRIGDWKAIRRSMATGNQTVELYDLSKDPNQTRDIASMFPRRVATMTERMNAVRTPSNEFPLVGVDIPAKTPK